MNFSKNCTKSIQVHNSLANIKLKDNSHVYIKLNYSLDVLKQYQVKMKIKAIF